MFFEVNIYIGVADKKSKRELFRREPNASESAIYPYPADGTEHIE